MRTSEESGTDHDSIKLVQVVGVSQRPLPGARWGLPRHRGRAGVPCRARPRPQRAAGLTPSYHQVAHEPDEQARAAFVMAPLEFVQRLAALVPRPRLHATLSWPSLARNAKTPRNIAPRAGPQNPPIPGRGPVCLTAHEPSSTLPLDEKACLKSLFAVYIVYRILDLCASPGLRTRESGEHNAPSLG